MGGGSSVFRSRRRPGGITFAEEGCASPFGAAGRLVGTEAVEIFRHLHEAAESG